LAVPAAAKFVKNAIGAPVLAAGIRQVMGVWR